MRLRRNNSVVADAFCVLWLWILANRAASNEPPSERPQSDDPRQASVPMTGPQVSKGSGPVWPQLGGKAADPRMHRANTRPIPSRPCSCVSGGVGLTASLQGRPSPHGKPLRVPEERGEKHTKRRQGCYFRHQNLKIF